MRYIQHPITHELIPADEYVRPEVNSTHMVMPDITDYKSMIDGSIITSRSKHRAHLRQHGCEEVGNDSTVLNPKRKPLESPPGLKQELLRAFDQHIKRR